MADRVLRHGDMAVFEPNFGAATVVVRPGTLTGSGPAAVGGRKACVAGDEGRLTVPGCAYTTASHTVPGLGTLSIRALAADQQATRTTTGGSSVLLVGSRFTATFGVQVPAQQPQPTGPPIPDPTPQYSGSGRFAGTNSTVRAG